MAWLLWIPRLEDEFVRLAKKAFQPIRPAIPRWGMLGATLFQRFVQLLQPNIDIPVFSVDLGTKFTNLANGM